MCQQLLIPFFQFGRWVRFGLLLKPADDAFIGRVGLDGGCELFAGDARKLKQPIVHRTGIDILALAVGKDGAAFVDHASQVGIAGQLDSHAAREVFP